MNNKKSKNVDLITTICLLPYTILLPNQFSPRVYSFRDTPVRNGIKAHIMHMLILSNMFKLTKKLNIQHPFET